MVPVSTGILGFISIFKGNPLSSLDEAQRPLCSQVGNRVSVLMST